MSLELILPRGVEKPAYLCRLCRAHFFVGQEAKFERHVIRCCKAHEAEIDAMRPSVRNPHLQGGLWDKDLERWMAENRDALVEDRKRL